MPSSKVSTAIIFAPLGRDSQLAAALLQEGEIDTTVCNTLADVEREISDNTSFLILTEDAVSRGDLKPLARWVDDQQSWSDLPVILIVGQGGGTERNPSAARYSSILGNVTFLERPFHPTTLLSMARTALRGRRRQYEARTRLEALREGEDRLRKLNETLEQRVLERTRELEDAHTLVLEQAAERQRAEQILRQSQKMEAVGQLTGGVAHDFNNLLMAVLGNLDLLRKHAVGDAKATRLIEGAMKGARRGASLTQRLLAFSRQQDLNVRSVDLGELIAGMSELLQRSIGSHIECIIRAPAGLPAAHVDPNQIELALLNLVVNARDAMPKGGVITIELFDGGVVEGAKTGTAAQFVVVAVSDTGVGMSEETLSRAIEPFYSTKEIGKGTGLGLSMIHGLAVQLNGKLQLESKVGRGTRAELWLPVSNLQAGPVLPVANSTEPAPSTGRSKILVVDDDALIAMSTVDMLEDLGHEVVEANSGAKALEILREDFDVELLITDHAMPQMTGAELATAVRTLRPELPILLATGYADLPEGHLLDVPRLSKPYSQDQLAQEIAMLLARAV